MQETQIQSLGQEDPPEEEMATPSSIPVAQLVKNPSAMWETWVRSLGWEDRLEKGEATHCSAGMAVVVTTAVLTVVGAHLFV